MAAAKYTLIEITRGLDYDSAGGMALNDHDDALIIVQGASGGLIRSLLWKQGKFVEVAAKSRSNQHCVVRSLNNACEAVGVLSTDRENQAAFYWRDGEMTMLPTLGGKVTYVQKINNTGMIVGSSLYPSKGKGPCGVLWKNGKIIDTGQTISNRWNEFVSINDKGDIAGYERLDGRYCSFTYSGKSVEYLPTDLGNMPKDINVRKQLVGSIDSKDRRSETAFLFADKQLRKLGTLGGSMSRAKSVNDSMTVVGNSYFGSKTDEHPFLWKDGKVVDLNKLLNVRDVEFTSAIAVNNHGSILCNGISQDKLRVYLLKS